MEITEFLEKLNKSDFGKSLRADRLKLSQSALDDINKKYGINLTQEKIDGLISFGLLERNLDPEIYQDVVDRNEFEFSNIDEIKKVLRNSIDFSILTPEIVEMLKETLEFTGVNHLKLTTITPDILDLSQLPVDSLEIGYGGIDSETISKLPNVKSLEIRNVEFHSISELLALTNLTALTVNVNPDDPQLDMTDIDKFQGLTKFDISGQTLSQEDFEKICQIKSLTSLDIGAGKINKDFHCEGNNISDLSAILNLSNLQESTTSTLRDFIHSPVINNVDEFRKLVNLEIFKNYDSKKVTYVGNEPLPADLLEGIDNIELTILTPFAVGKEFAEKYESGFPGKLKINSDSYQDYTTPEIYAIAQKMEEIIATIPKDASDFEKAAAIYEVIGKNCFYDRTGCIGEPEYIDGREEVTRSLRGAFIENKLVCRGYALAFKKLADELGLESVIASGEAIGDDGVTELGSHVWNQVKIDGEWYNLDLTWDARNIRGKNELEWFLLNSQEFDKSHKGYSLDKNMRDFMSEGKFDYLGYDNAGIAGEEPHECSQSYDKQKIAEYFETQHREFEPSNTITSTIAHSEITIPMIESEMALMAAAENSRGTITEEKQEERND